MSRLGGGSYQCVWIPSEGTKKDCAELFTVVAGEEARGNVHKLKYRKLHSNIRGECGQTFGTGCLERLCCLPS